MLTKPPTTAVAAFGGKLFFVCKVIHLENQFRLRDNVCILVVVVVVVGLSKCLNGSSENDSKEREREIERERERGGKDGRMDRSVAKP